MATSDFWRDLAVRFRALPDSNKLHAEWDCTVGGRKVCWRLIGGTDGGPQAQFEALARRAAFEIANPGDPDLLVAWLEALRENGWSEPGSHYDEQNADGSEGLRHTVGTIARACEASANVCKTLESQTLQAEFEEKQRNHPKNWSPLRQRFESFKTIKELRAGPHEHIPESLVKEVLAQQYGIKPEEVTRKQIQFEVSRLLPDYPAIRVVPSEPESAQTEPELPVNLKPAEASRKDENMSAPGEYSFRWEDLDQRLLSPKTNDLAEEMQRRSTKAEAEIAFETARRGNSAGYLPRLFEFHEQLTNEWAERLYAAHCEAWSQQNRTLSAELIRAVRDRPIAQLIAARKSSVQAGVCLRGSRTGTQPNSIAMGEWSRRMDRLAARWIRKLEAEAVESEYRASRDSQVYCARLEKEALENSTVNRKETTARSGKRATRPKPPCFESAVEQLKKNSKLTLVEFCRLMDRKAEQFPNSLKYLPPKTWKVRRFFEQYEKRSNTVSRFLSDVRRATNS